MISRTIARRFSDFAHKQVSAGFSKKYGQNFEKVFGKKPSQTVDSAAKESAKDLPKQKSESK